MRKKSILALALLLCLGLSGCGEVLAGSYQTSVPHVDRPATAEDSSAIRVENYRELVSAVLYLVSQGEDGGTLQFYDYPEDVETALTNACLEVATQDPLGAYCVDYIRHETTRVVSYDQATLSIHYRRTMDQVHSMVRVTGTSAIRTELREALANFEPEVVLRVTYFSEDEESIRALIRQAYYDNPVSALGFPQVEINLYPDSGNQRVVEILLTYPESVEELRAKAADLSHMVADIVEGYWDLEPNQILPEGVKALAERVTYDPEGPANAYSALTEGQANSEGMALTYILLCGRAFWVRGWDCSIVEGVLRVPVFPEEMDPEETEGPEFTELPHFWVSLHFPNGETLYLDPSNEALSSSTAQEMFDAGYRWPGGPVDLEPEAGIQPLSGEENSPAGSGEEENSQKSG